VTSSEVSFADLSSFFRAAPLIDDFLSDGFPDFFVGLASDDLTADDLALDDLISDDWASGNLGFSPSALALV